MNLYRVVYGKSDTPEELREYQLNGSGPVGTKEEWNNSCPDEELIFFENSFTR